MTGNDDHEGVAPNRLGDRADCTGSLETQGDLVIGEGLAAGNFARGLIDALVEGGNSADIERDVGEIARLGPQQRGNSLDCFFDNRRRTHLARVGVKLEQPLAGFDLARLGKLHADQAGMAPRDAAMADRRAEYRVRPPRHTLFPTSTIAPSQAAARQKIGIWSGCDDFDRPMAWRSASSRQARRRRGHSYYKNEFSVSNVIGDRAPRVGLMW